MRLKIVLGSALVIALLVAGCGGGGDSSSGASTSSGGSTTGDTGASTNANSNGSGAEASESKPLSKTEFNTRVNEICIQVPPGYQEELKKLEKKTGKKPSKAETNLKAAVPPLNAAVEQFETLTPPKGEEEKLEKMISAMEAAAEGLEEEPNSELSGPKSPFAEFQAVSKEFGFETCSGL